MKNFVVELPADVLTATVRKSEHKSAHPKRALLTRSTGIILLDVANFAKPKKRVMYLLKTLTHRSLHGSRKVRNRPYQVRA